MSPVQEVRLKPGKNYPKEFKARVALEAIREQKTIAELSDCYAIVMQVNFDKRPQM